MKKNILLLITVLFFSLGDAQAQVYTSNFYTKVLSGVNFLQNTTIDGNKSTYQTGYIISGAVGFCGRFGLCLEAEYTFRRNNIKRIEFFGEGHGNHGHFQSSSYMGNLLWYVPLSSCGFPCWDIKPFIGAGLGYDFQQMHSSNSRIVFHQKWHNFSWQAMTGVAYPLFCNTEVSLEYKFHQGGRHFNNHSIGIGLEYKFGF